MQDAISSDSKQDFIYASFSMIKAGTLIVIKDQDDKVITAFKTSRDIGNLLYSSKDLNYKSYKIYTGGTIDGEETNGLYTKINSYTNGEEIIFNDAGVVRVSQNKDISKTILIILIIEIILLVLSLTTYIKRSSKNEQEIIIQNPTLTYVIIALLVIILGALWFLLINGNSKQDNSGNQGNNPQGMNNNNSKVSYSAAKEITKDEDITSGEYKSSNADENAISVSGNVTSTLSNITVSKNGDSDGGDNTSFYGTNSAIIAKDGATLNIKNANITTDATGANGVFSYGGSATTNNTNSDGTVVNISDSTITTTKGNSGGIMTTGGGTTNAKNLTITTSGQSSAAIRSDRGGGKVTVDGGTYTTNGVGSPAIYSTADITVKNAKLVSTSSEGAIIEGKNSITLENVELTDTHTKNIRSKTYKNIFIYQSMSGDAAEGVATFTAKDSTITTNKGDSFYISNTSAIINLTNNKIINNDSTGYFLRAGADAWGNTGSNGGKVTLNLTNQEINGNIGVDEVSSLAISMTSSSFKGMIDAKDGEVNLNLDKTSTITLTGDSYVTSLTNLDNSNSNINLNGYKLYVDGKEYKV